MNNPIMVAIAALITPHSAAGTFAIVLAALDLWCFHGAFDGWDGVLFGVGIGLMTGQVIPAINASIGVTK